MDTCMHPLESRTEPNNAGWPVACLPRLVLAHKKGDTHLAWTAFHNFSSRLSQSFFCLTTQTPFTSSTERAIITTRLQEIPTKDSMCNHRRNEQQNKRRMEMMKRMETPKNEKPLKIVILGGRCTGKTSLLIQV